MSLIHKNTKVNKGKIKNKSTLNQIIEYIICKTLIFIIKYRQLCKKPFRKSCLTCNSTSLLKVSWTSFDMLVECKG